MMKHLIKEGSITVFMRFHHFVYLKNSRINQIKFLPSDNLVFWTNDMALFPRSYMPYNITYERSNCLTHNRFDID